MEFFKKYVNACIFVVLLLGTFLIFYKTLFFGFFSDDYHFLYITATQDSVWKYLFTNNVRGLVGGSYGPMLNIFFTLQYKLFGVHAFWYHVVTILSYTITAFVLYLFSLRLSKNNLLGLYSAILFLVLHNHVSAVSWVAVQTHVFATLFFVLGLYVYYVYIIEHKKWYFLLSFVLMTVSIFTKESALMFLPILVLIELFFGAHVSFKKTLIQIITRLTPFALMVIAFLLARFAVVGYVAGYYANQHAGFDLIAKAKMFVELSVNMIFSWPVRRLVSVWFFDHKIVLALCGVALIFLTHFGTKKYRKELWFLLLSYVLVSIPFVFLAFNPFNNNGERYSYLLSTFFVLYLNLLIFGLCERFKRSTMLFGITMSILIVLSIIQLIPKLGYWQAAGTVRDKIFSDFSAHKFEKNSFVVFVGLPDNVAGAEVLRNAVGEALYFETDLGYIAGERLPFYIEPKINDMFKPVLKLRQENELTYRLVSIEKNERPFVGFRIFDFPLVKTQMDEFRMYGDSGSGVTMRFDEDTLNEFKQKYDEIILAYFDGEKMNFLEL